MASNRACRACKRALQQHSTFITKNTSRASLVRSFSAAPIRRVQQVTPAPPEGPLAVPDKDTQPHPYRDAEGMSQSAALANALRKNMGGATETYAAYGVTEVLFKECARQADYKIVKDESGEPPKSEKGEDLGVGEGWWYSELGLTPTFNTWAQVTFLHMYLLTVRMRLFPVSHAPAWHQHLTDHFSYEAENRMVTHHNMAARGIRNQYLKDLFIQWRGVMTAYDEGLVKGDAVLATALWRNIYKGEKVDGVGLATLVAYVRRNVARLEEMATEEIAAGQLSFSNPAMEKEWVLRESQALKEPFAEGEKAE